MQPRQWDDREGQKRTTMEIVANNFRMLGGRAEGGMAAGAGAGASAGAGDTEPQAAAAVAGGARSGPPGRPRRENSLFKRKPSSAPKHKTNTVCRFTTQLLPHAQ